MKRHLNTLFVTTQGAYLSKEGEAVLVRVENETRLRVPIHTLGGIVCFGQIGCSSFLMGLCGERGVSISFLTENRRFFARVHGFTPGNVLLRREHYRRADDAGASTEIARSVVLGKVANARTVLQRAGRDHPENGDPGALQHAIAQMDRCVRDAQSAPSLDGPSTSAAAVRPWTTSTRCSPFSIRCSRTTRAPPARPRGWTRPSAFCTVTAPAGPAWRWT